MVPSFIVKLIAPYFIDRLPYRVRIPLLVALSFVGMQMVAWQESLPARLFGVILASISSGLGELSFLGMTHFYGEFAIPFWGSGTGAAGLLGAGMYVAATSWLGLSVRASIMAFGFLPGLMLVAFFVVLPLEPLKMSVRRGYARIEDDDDELDISDGGAISHRSRSISPRSRSRTPKDTDIHGLLARLRRTKSLFLP